MTSTIALGGLLRYLIASPASRGSSIRRLRDEAASAYSVQTDFWLAMRNAVAADRRTTRDGASLRAAAANASEKRRDSYALAAAKWSQVSPRWADCMPEPVESAALSIGGVELTFRPSFAERHPGGETEIVLVWYRKDKPNEDVIRAALLALTLAYPECTPVFVDLPRAAVHTDTGTRLRRYETWLTSEVAGLAHLLNQVA
ncbi:hypothetical protein ACT17Q_14925 [Cellulomonas sp. CW35]|uniref:hypothetical protein n=1 Tax=Cellulomonas sp. CW35 TaxID=3458249 RepID=UPI0040343073